MLCDKCKERPATVHYTQIINGVKTEMNLCEQCAQEEGLLNSETFSPFVNFAPFSVQDLLAGLMNFLPNTGNTYVEEQLKCNNCGMTYDRFRETGRLGCSRCYDSFADELNPLIRRIHGSIGHRGKIPRKTGGVLRAKREIEELKAKLEKAVKEEAFEEAAKLRDKIRELEKKYGK